MTVRLEIAAGQPALTPGRVQTAVLLVEPTGAPGRDANAGGGGVSEQEAAQIAADAAAAAVSAHEDAVDPHPQYLVQIEGDGRYDAAGAAASGDGAHLAAGDPHAQYLTAARGDARYEAAGAAAAAVAALVASSPALLDTLAEIAAAIGNDPGFATTMATALGNRLRIDAAQALTGGQQAQGRANLGLGSAALQPASAFDPAGTAATAIATLVASSPATLDTLAELAAALGNDANFATTIATALGNRVRVDAAQGLSAAQKLAARSNIDAAAARSAIVVLAAPYLLTSQTAAQKLFNHSANGALTLDVGLYEFECVFGLTGMSSTSGSFGFAIGGTATFTQAWHDLVTKGTMAVSGAFAGWNTAAQATLTSNNTSTTAAARISGVLRVIAAGTIIPQVSLGVAAAATVIADSRFSITQIDVSPTFASAGAWS